MQEWEVGSTYASKIDKVLVENKDEGKELWLASCLSRGCEVRRWKIPPRSKTLRSLLWHNLPAWRSTVQTKRCRWGSCSLVSWMVKHKSTRQHRFRFWTPIPRTDFIYNSLLLGCRVRFPHFRYDSTWYKSWKVVTKGVGSRGGTDRRMRTGVMQEITCSWTSSIGNLLFLAFRLCWENTTKSKWRRLRR